MKLIIRILQKVYGECQKLRVGVKQAISIDGVTPEYTLKDNLLYKGDALYVPDDAAVKAQLLRIYYNDPLASYFG
jgi:hypothetical protein